MENGEFKTIGYRKSGMGALYIFALILGIGLIVAGIFLAVGDPEAIVRSIIMFFVSGLLVIIFSIMELVEYKETNPNVISTDGERIKVNGNIFFIKDIEDVSYKKAHSRYGTYNYGNITIRTKESCHVAQFVAECESVSKKITKLMYEKKNLEQ